MNPQFLYCSELYDGCFTTGAKKLQIAQNQALCAVLRHDTRSDTQSLHNDAAVPWLDVQRKISVCIQTYRLTNGIGPTTLVEEFEPQIGARQLRSAIKVIHKHARRHTRFAERDFVFRAKEYWKQIPAEIQSKPSVDSFKNAMKSTQIFGHVR